MKQDHTNQLKIFYDELSFYNPEVREQFAKAVKRRFPEVGLCRWFSIRYVYMLKVKGIQDDEYFPWLISRDWCEHSTRYKLAQYQPHMEEKLDQWLADALKLLCSGS